MTKTPAIMSAISQRMPGGVGANWDGDGVQLALFDFRPTYRLLCLPMADLHGRTFARIFSLVRPSAVVDIRDFPYFDLISLSRTSAFELFERHSARYHHLPLDLSPPATQSARWQLRENTTAMLARLLDGHNHAHEQVFAFLLHDFSEMKILEQAVRSPRSDTKFKWQIEFPQTVHA